MDETIQKISLTEKVALKILTTITSRRELERIDYLKCKLGIEVLLINISKMAVIYTVAILADILLYTLVFHVGYIMIRNNAYGAHAKDSFVCTIMSCFMFVGLPWLISNYMPLSRWNLLIMLLIGFPILFRFAPAETKKNPIKSEKRKKKLRKQALRIQLLLFIVALMLPLHIGTLVMGGTFVACIMVLPFSSILPDKAVSENI